MLTVADAAPDLGGRAIAIVALVVLGLIQLPASAVLVLVGLLAAGTAAGAAVGTRIEAAGHLLPVAVVSSLADSLSVLTPGAPSDVVADSPTLLSLLAIPWPMPGTSDVPPVLGVGDVVFVALYLAAGRKHGLPRARSRIAIAVGLGATAVAVAITALALPALPFIGAAFVIAHPEARRLPPRDRRTAAIGTVILALVACALVLSRASR